MDKTNKRFLNVAIAPLLLTIVACGQLFLAHTQALSPWKGGGFGMFSTNDAVDARFVRAYLVTPAGDVPIVAGQTATLRRLALHVRTLPTTRGLTTLATELAGQVWVPATYDPLDILDEDMAAVLDAGPRFRIRDEYEPLPGKAEARFTAVRVELWRYQFDAQSGQIQTHQALAITQPRLD